MRGELGRGQQPWAPPRLLPLAVVAAAPGLTEGCCCCCKPWAAKDGRAGRRRELFSELGSLRKPVDKLSSLQDGILGS